MCNSHNIKVTVEDSLGIIVKRYVVLSRETMMLSGNNILKFYHVIEDVKYKITLEVSEETCIALRQLVGFDFIITERSNHYNQIIKWLNNNPVYQLECL